MIANGLPSCLTNSYVQQVEHVTGAPSSQLVRGLALAAPNWKYVSLDPTHLAMYYEEAEGGAPHRRFELVARRFLLLRLCR